jgi:anti-sigma factor RsiW
MIFHPRTREIYDFADDELARADRIRIARHLQRCQRCRNILADLRHIDRLVAAMPVARPPAQLKARIFAAVARGDTPALPPEVLAP